MIYLNSVKGFQRVVCDTANPTAGTKTLIDALENEQTLEFAITLLGHDESKLRSPLAGDKLRITFLDVVEDGNASVSSVFTIPSVQFFESSSVIVFTIEASALVSSNVAGVGQLHAYLKLEVEHGPTSSD